MEIKSLVSAVILEVLVFHPQLMSVVVLSHFDGVVLYPGFEAFYGPEGGISHGGPLTKNKHEAYHKRYLEQI